MPPAGVIRYTLSGTLASGATKWATSFWLESMDGVTDQANVNAVDAALDSAGVYLSILSAMTNQDRLESLDAYGYTGGSGASSTAHKALGVAGNGVGSELPKATCMVATLRTATPGRTGRGRMYLPATSCDVSAATGLLDVNRVTAMVNAWATFLTDLEDPSRWVLWSRKANVLRPITQIDADRVPDHQEHRERGLVTTRIIGTD